MYSSSAELQRRRKEHRYLFAGCGITAAVRVGEVRAERATPHHTTTPLAPTADGSSNHLRSIQRTTVAK